MGVRSLHIDECTEGIRIAEHIYNEYGAVIIPKGTALNSYIKDKLKSTGLTYIKIYENANGSDGNSDTYDDGFMITEEVKKVHKESTCQIRNIVPKIHEGESPDMKTIDNITKSILDERYGRREIIRCVNEIRSKDEYTYQHLVNVAMLSMLIASWLKLPDSEVQLVTKAGLIHDLGKAVDREQEGTHTALGGEIARKYREHPEVIHCILSHHNDEEPQTVEAVLVQAADAFSAARPGARREMLENYIKRLAKLEEIANSFTGVDKSFAIQSGRELRIIVKPEDVNDEGIRVMAKQIAKQIEDEMEFPGQIRVNVIRETRSVELAK